jgi:hypothetical protein
MEKLFTLTAIIAFAISVSAQSPQKMSYQAVIRNSSDQLVTNHAIGMRISILQGSSTGTPAYVETQTPTTNVNGLATIEIGGGTIVAGTFAGIDWSTGTYFIKTETDPTGGTSYTITGTSQLLSVPYALYAKIAKTADYNDLTNKPTLFDGTWTSLTGKPTTLAGYEITNAMSTSHVANGITSAMITNWNAAYGWGNHSGLYRPIGYVPAWNEITGRPTFATVATSGSYNDLSNKPTILNSQWTTSGSNIYYNSGNVGIGTSSPATYFHVHGIPIASRGQLALSSPAGQDIFQSFYEADIFKAYLWYDVSDQDLRLQNYTAGDLNLNPYGGKVGIGTNTPNESLTVNGNAEINGNIIPNGKIIAPGNITIESSGNNVIVLAGANKITISPSGGVTIESNNITLAATGNLTLSGQTVNINGTTVEINASAAAKLKGSASAEVSSSAVTTIKGSLVQIN